MAFNFEVVVSGISGRFPECDDIDTFKRKLYSGSSKEFITNNEKKWTQGFKNQRLGKMMAVPNPTGKYTNEVDFDFRFFKFNQLFARSTDTINRKILEPSFEAIVDAGINPHSLDGANIGVFASAGIPERDMFTEENITNVIFVLGNSRTMAPNRLSYALNFTGPSFAFHCDPLGGLEALKVAKNLISDGSIEGAVVAVSSNVTDPKFSYLYMNLDMLTPEECCRSFDKNARGFVRSESTVVLFLQRAQDAKRHYAKLEFCEAFFEGLSHNTLLGFDEEYLRNSLRVIYERNKGGAFAGELAFVEMTGNAIKNLESIEANAVADILCKGRKSPLLVGSLKSNVGHTEAASGFLSIVKLLLALNSQMIAPNADLLELNDDIRAFREKQMEVVVNQTELGGNTVAVNIVGLCGTVYHAVFQNNSRNPDMIKPDDIPRLVLMSGRTSEGLRKALKKIQSDPFNTEVIALVNDVFQDNIPLHIFRGFTILPKPGKKMAVIDERGNPHRPICFIFSGMGSQWNGMGKELLDFPIIADVIKRCDAVLRPKSIDIYEVLLSEDPTMFDDITMSFVAIICMQIALVEVLKKLGVVPDLILGHSVGENGCAYADGCLSLEQSVLVSYARGIASVSTKTVKGMMAAVGKGYEEIRHQLPANIEVACHNAVNSCTLSGPADDIEAYVTELKSQRIFAKGVNVSNIAYHSKYITPAAPKLLELLKKVIPEPKTRSSKWISSSVPESEWLLPAAGQCSAEYLTNNLLKPVLFEEACRHIPKDAICIEIAPHGLLQAILKKSLPETCTNITLTMRSANKDNLNFLLSGIGKLYIAGSEPKVNNLYPPVKYPVSRGTPSISPYCTWYHAESDSIQPPYKSPLPIPLSKENIAIRINEDAEFNYLKDHQINDKTVIPPALFLYLVWRILSILRNSKMDQYPVLFEKVKFHKNVEVFLSRPRQVNITILATGSFEVLSRFKGSNNDDQVIMTGRVELIKDADQIHWTEFGTFNSNVLLDADEIKTILKDAGFSLGESFQLLNSVQVKDADYRGKIEWRGNWVTFLDSIMKFQMLSDLKKLKLCFIHSIRRMILDPTVVNSQELGCQMVVDYTQVTKCVQCKGVEITDARWKQARPMKASKSPSLTVRKMIFVSHSNPSCQNPTEFVDLSMQISFESSRSTDTACSKLYICDYTGNFIKIIKRSEVIKNSENKIVFCAYQGLSAKISTQDSYFLIAEESIPNINISSMENLFILLIVTNNNANISSQFVSITKQSFAEKLFILLKKKPHCTPSFRIERSNINNRLSNGSYEVENETLIRSDLDSASLSLMCSRNKYKGAKYIFIPGNKKLSLENDPEFKSILLTNLPNMVRRNHEWGSYRYMASNLILSDYENCKLKKSLNSIEIESIHVECLRYENIETQLNENSSDLENKLFGIKYSGLNGAGKKVMGLTSCCSTQPVAKMDPLLTWEVPDEWTINEAVTVPAVYAYVYSVMELIENCRCKLSSVLITTDRKNVCAKALISLCSMKNMKIYVGVPTKEDAIKLKSDLNSLNGSNLIIDEKDSLEVFLRKTVDVNVMVNFLPDFKSTLSSIECLAKFCMVIETVESKLNADNEMGLYVFLRSCSFYMRPYRITPLLDLPEDVKNYIHKSVKEGIETGFVKPLSEKPDTVFEETKEMGVDESSKQLKSVPQVTSQTKSQIPQKSLKFAANRSHIIIGGERGGDACMKIIQWLRERNATNFVVIVEKFSSSPRMSSQINRLLCNKKITISFESLNKLNSVEDAVQLIEDTNKMAPLDSIFFVSMESSSKIINHLNEATQVCKEKVKFISLFAGGLEAMEERQSKGFPAFVLHGESFPKNLPAVLTEFEAMLKMYNPIDGQSVFYQIVENSDSSDLSDKMISSLKLILPKSIDNLEQIGRNILKEVRFVEMSSRSVKYADSRGVYPIFAVPGLHAFGLQPIFNSLMYPVFCASLTESSSSARDTASTLFQHLNCIQKKGPVTLIGETWNAVVALELSSLIKKSGRKFKLFLLEGNPMEWESTINTLNLTNSQEFEKVMTKIYGKEIQEHIHPWDGDETKTEHHPLNKISNRKSDINSADVHRCLRVLKKQFINAQEYSLNSSIIEYTVFFFSKDSPISLALSDSSDVICINADTYESFIKNHSIRKIINKQAMFLGR